MRCIHSSNGIILFIENLRCQALFKALLHILTHLIFTTASESVCCYYIHFFFCFLKKLWHKEVKRLARLESGRAGIRTRAVWL